MFTTLFRSIQYIVQNMFFKNSIYIIYLYLCWNQPKKHVVVIQLIVSLNGLKKKTLFQISRGGKGSQRATALQLFRAMQSADMKPDSWPRWWTVPHSTYCWWTKSCTTKDDDYPIIYRVLYIPGGAGFLPSTVAHEFLNRNIIFQSGIIIHFFRVQL